jgi:hypothetical protein
MLLLEQMQGYFLVVLPVIIDMHPYYISIFFKQQMPSPLLATVGWLQHS